MCDVNLLTLPLHLVDNNDLEPQRCYLPQCVSGIKATGWSRCWFSDGSHSICWVSQTRAGSETCCFLDSMVSSKPQLVVTNQHLTQVEPLLLATETVDKVACMLTISERFLQTNTQISVDELREDLRIFLRHLKLANNCYVQHERLQKIGITSVQILHVTGLQENEIFEIEEKTPLLIVDIKLEMPMSLREHTKYLSYSFETVMEVLEEQLNLSKRKYSSKILLVGPMGCGKSSILSEFLNRQQANCFYVTASKVLRSYPGETEEELRRVFHAAESFQQKLRPKLPIILVLEDLELLCPASTKESTNSLRISAELYRLVDNLPPGILCLASTSYPDLLHEQARRAGRFGQEISIQMPNEEQRKLIFQDLLCDLELPGNLLEHLAKNTQGYVLADMALLARQVHQQMLKKDFSELEHTVRELLLTHQPSASRSTDVRVVKMSDGFEIIGGMESLKKTLRVTVLAGLSQSAAFARFGLSLPKGVLLYGPPGCAKTTVAKCLAKEASMTFIATSAAEVYSPYVGCAERFISRIFDTARKNAPCLIFLDEIDSLVGRRTTTGAGSGGSGQVQMRILSTLLTEMDGIIAGQNQHHILVVAATNRPDMIDDALMRPGRFDKLIHVPAPDLESRLALLKLQAKRMPFHCDVNLENIAQLTSRFSGADLCNLCNEAAIESIQRDFDATAIEWQDFEKVLNRQKSSLTQAQIDAYYKFAYKFL
ncbi:uncharacterized protein [Drosophila tropicalis]|uniref:uncharacterized protein n=1 Tax=Drosophila tropicalis TaxID=46794 RepID=UPI0035ABAF72